MEIGYSYDEMLMLLQYVAYGKFACYDRNKVRAICEIGQKGKIKFWGEMDNAVHHIWYDYS